MILKHKLPVPRTLWRFWGVVAIILAATAYFLIWHPEPITLFVGPKRTSPPTPPVHRTLLFHKTTHPEKLLYSKGFNGDLWLRNERGTERHVASDIVRASFSPDGKKFAYATIGHDLFIETIEGKQLAHLTGALDHSWSSDSSRVTFLAVASADYPDLQQTMIYDLNQDQTSQLQGQE